MGKLYIVPTPIGNLGDITLRALEVLKSVDVILAEDTRKTAFLLKHFEIQKPISSHHKFNEHKTAGNWADRIAGTENAALVTDAGTPGISDPGFLLIRACIEKDVEVETLPGATAFVPALVNSGLPSEKFVFEGFLPQKKGRQKRLKELADEERTMIFYESPFRLLKSMNEFREYFGEDRRISVSRELSKIYEETRRGTVSELIEFYEGKDVKGEIVIVLAGKKSKKRKTKNEK
jgi:16S rRNA (cytidine1402-2'-O)-methyltransferase